jgi:hypothetical protein
MSLRHARDVPLITIDLDKSPTERWAPIVDKYKGELLAADQQLQKFAGDNLPWVTRLLADGLISSLSTASKRGAVVYGQELAALADMVGISLGRLVLLQLVYEASATCTSIVVQNEDGSVFHARTMDWEMPFSVEALTVELIFRSHGRELFRASSWAGYVGVLTGMKPGAFAISVNFRLTKEGSFWTNVKQTLKSAWPVGFLVREVLQSESEYQGALVALASSPLISPAYFTLSGVERGEGCIVTRNAIEEVMETERPSVRTGAPCVQTNIDGWSCADEEDIMWSIRRREVARERLIGVLRYDELWSVLSAPPVCNSLTIYGTVMSAGEGVLETRLLRSSGTFVVGDPVDRRASCSRCARRFSLKLNPTGFCQHSGTFHSSFSDCSVGCAFGLGVQRLGLRHWSCCYQVNPDPFSTCPKSRPHTCE